MSKAIKCDRCGYYFVPDEEQGEYVHIDQVLFKNVIRPDGRDGIRTETFGDLCPTCTKKFVQFCSRVDTVDKKLYDDLMTDYQALLSSSCPDITDGQICHIHTEDEE